MVRNNSADLEFTPPVKGVSRLDFASGQHLVEPAYRYALDHIERWRAGNDD
jgi:hypothetical protein